MKGRRHPINAPAELAKVDLTATARKLASGFSEAEVYAERLKQMPQQTELLDDLTQLAELQALLKQSLDQTLDVLWRITNTAQSAYDKAEQANQTALCVELDGIESESNMLHTKLSMVQDNIQE